LHRVAAKHILTVLALVFLVLGARRTMTHGLKHPQARTWLVVGGIFSLVGAWLWMR
jgi:hypothetical protein